jgi:hypothetical protein
VRPRLGGRVPADDVQPDTELQFPTVRRRTAADAGEPLGDLRGSLSPCQVGVHVLRSDLLGCGRCTPEEHLWRIPVAVIDARTGDLVVAAVQVEGRSGRLRRDSAEDRQELTGAVIALVVAEVVAESCLFDWVTNGHDVQQQPTAEDALEGRRLMRCESR